MNIVWTEERPEETGLYIFKEYGYWTKRIKEIKQGDWRLRQDPLELYANEELLFNLHGYWFGPIPTIPEKKI